MISRGKVLFLPLPKISDGPHVSFPGFVLSIAGVDNHCYARWCRHTMALPNGRCVTSLEAKFFCCMYTKDVFVKRCVCHISVGIF